MKLFISANGIQNDYMTDIVAKARTLFDEVKINCWGRRPTHDELHEVIRGYDALICGAEKITEDLIDYASDSLKVISRFGVGYDNIDVAAASRRGIFVCNAPGANMASVADLAMCHILNLMRRAPLHERLLREGEWPRLTPTHALEGKTLGLIGFGAIGKQVARRASGFGLSIVAYDLYFDEKAASAYGVRQVSLNELYAVSDIISLHAPSNDETYRMINTASISKMKDGVYLVNTARGELVDEKALIEALRSGKIAAAGLDVYDKEPLKESPLLELENVVLTPHIGALTTEAYRQMASMAIENAYAVLSDSECRFVVNAASLNKKGE